MSDIKVSVVIAAWNAAGFIEGAIRSALGQTLSQLEVIVVDDASSDDTVAAAEAAGRGDGRLRVMRSPSNQGPAGARNLGFAAASGDWVAVLDSDDFLEPERLERLACAGERLRADIIADDMLKLADIARPEFGEGFLDLDVAAGPRKIGLGEFALGNLLFHGDRQTGYLKPLFRRQFLERQGVRYDQHVRIGEDFLFVLECLGKGARYAIHPSRGYRYLVRPGSISRVLGVDDVQSLFAGYERVLERIGYAVPPHDARALARYEAALMDAAAFLRSIEAVKTRRFGAAALEAVRRPLAMRHWRLPIGERLRRARAMAGGA